jgi:hypothetical protein
VPTLTSFYASAAAVTNPAHRRWAAGAGYYLGDAVRRGESIAAARARILTVPQYATGLEDAELTAAFNAIDTVP